MASDFDPWNQTVTIRLGDGTPVDVPLDFIDMTLQYALRANMSYAAQLGASLILFVILVLLTRAEKRDSYVFWLNGLSLVLNIARLFCTMLFFTSNFFNTYTLVSGDLSRVHKREYATSVLGAVFSGLLMTTAELSLVLQVQVVCSNLRRIYRRSLLCLSVIVATVVMAFQYWLMGINCKFIIEGSDPRRINWLESTTNIIFTASICFFCAIFVTKLGFAIRLRRTLGKTDLGPMKVIFIMGCQTMVIPAMLSITHYFVEVPELSSNVVTLVILSLPLSSIWAGTVLGKPSTPSNIRNFWQILSFSGQRTKRSTYTATTATGTTTSSIAKQCTHCYSESRPLTDKDGVRNQEGPSPVSSSKYGIAVEHDISVQSARRDSFEV
ncbi:alpha-factor pheromone receptor STE2 [Aspergillus mulundensis]|uniref:Pheromone receptor PREB n=1 Tax=Aspergillus mulundensis TaxID=1810919 RepID=A0A3D8QZZ0_9EURO|nr:Pheromone receptor PREB [Aspergillus mulundensis]RDW67359.1 Pheromone receptor PREB [Aspergillus mulundensis]